MGNGEAAVYYYFDVDSKGKEKNEVDDVFENTFLMLFTHSTAPEVFGNTLSFLYISLFGFVFMKLCCHVPAATLIWVRAQITLYGVDLSSER